MAPMVDIANAALARMEQMKASLTTKDKKYDELLSDVKRNKGDLHDHYKSEKDKLEAIQEAQVRYFNPQVIIT